MPLTKDQAEMVANLTSAARPTGARQWDAPGIMAALAKVRHLDLAEVMIAAGRAARDRTLDTPGALGNPAAPCWVERPIERAVPEKTVAESRCGICGKSRLICQASPRFGGDEHAFEPDFKTKRGNDVVEIVDALKAEVTAMKEPADTDRVTPGAGRVRIESTEESHE